MTRLLRNPYVLFLLCSPIVLAGCQHPLAPPVTARQTTWGNHALVDAQLTTPGDEAMQCAAPAVESEVWVLDLGLPDSPKPKDASLVATVQKRPDSLTLQLGDALLLVLKTFTGR
jgi:hypothetical protein